MQHRASVVSRIVVLATSVLMAGVSPLVGQGGALGPSVLTLLPLENRRLQMGSQVDGVLSGTDYRSADGRYVQAWAFEGRAGQSVTFDLVSHDFDSYLYAVAPGSGDVLADDDGGGGCHSRIVLALHDAGVVRVVVSSQSLRATGGFTLTASPSPGPTRPEQCGSFNADVATFRSLPITGTLSFAEEVTSELTSGDQVDESGSYVQAWAVVGSQAQPVTIDLISDDFDAMLYLVGPGLSGALNDDDSGGGCHARITTILPDAGSYRVIATSLSPGMTGAFTLRMTAEPGEVVAGDCLGGDQVEFQPLSELSVAGRNLGQGPEVEGHLTADDVRYGDGSFVQAWGLTVVRGNAYTIDLRSDDFDSFLYVVGPGIDDLLTDDDAGGGCHARLTITPSEDGLVRVVVSSIGAGQTGAFTLRVSDEPGPVDPVQCRQQAG